MLTVSIDLEGVYEGLHENFKIPGDLIGCEAEFNKLERDVSLIYSALDKLNIKATFFCLGGIAKHRPSIIKDIIGSGHEIASHGFNHVRYYGLSKAVIQNEIVTSKKILEDVSGAPVLGFRAPDFSINKDSLYILDFIKEAGYKYDSSIYPISGHDVYGIAGWQREIHTLENGLIQFPAATIKIMNRVIPALGGGYFRLFPFWFSKFALKKSIEQIENVMLYLHPHDFSSERLDIDIPWLKRKRHFYNSSRTFDKITLLLKNEKCLTANEIINCYCKKNEVNKE